MQHPSTADRHGERGAVLLMVMMLVLLFTGLGLLAVRHSQAEMHSAGAYVDASQAAVLAESAIAMVVTDLRLSWDAPVAQRCGAGAHNYWESFQADAATADLQIPFSRVFDPTCAWADVPGALPDLELNGMRAPLALGGQHPMVDVDDAETLSTPLSAAFGSVQVTHAKPIPAPSAPGFSKGSTYGWYWIEVTSDVSYGADDGGNPASVAFSRGKAKARARLVLGPVKSFSGGDSN